MDSRFKGGRSVPKKTDSSCSCFPSARLSQRSCWKTGLTVPWQGQLNLLGTFPELIDGQRHNAGLPYSRPRSMLFSRLQFVCKYLPVELKRLTELPNLAGSRDSHRHTQRRCVGVVTDGCIYLKILISFPETGPETEERKGYAFPSIKSLLKIERPPILGCILEVCDFLRSMKRSRLASWRDAQVPGFAGIESGERALRTKCISAAPCNCMQECWQGSEDRVYGPLL